MTKLGIREVVSGVFIFFSITACVGLGVSSQIVLVPIDGFLHTPQGKFRFKTGDSDLRTRVSGLTSYIKQDVFAESDSVFVKLAPRGYGSFLKIISLGDDDVISVDFINSSYQIGDSKPAKIPFTDSMNYQDRRARVVVDSETAYGAYYGVSYERWPLTAIEVGAKVRYSIPFSIGDRKYLIDITSKFQKSYRPELKVPVISIP